MSIISIKGLPKAHVLKALYDGSHIQGMSILGVSVKPQDISVDYCQKIIDKCGEDLRFDYFNGRVLKIDLSGDEIDSRLYNRDCGEGAAEAVIEKLRHELNIKG